MQIAKTQTNLLLTGMYTPSLESYTFYVMQVIQMWWAALEAGCVTIIGALWMNKWMNEWLGDWWKCQVAWNISILCCSDKILCTTSQEKKRKLRHQEKKKQEKHTKRDKKKEK